MNVLKGLRDKKGVYQKDVARYLGVDRTTYVKYETGASEPGNDMLVKLSEYFDVPVGYLLGAEGIDKNTAPFSYGENAVLRIPVYGSIPAGLPMEAIEDVLDYEEAPASWSLGGKEFFALKIKGDSMSPDYLCGDIVVFERAETCDTGDDCAVMVNGDDATFKRVERKETGVVLKPLNPEYETLFFSNDEIETKPVRILGIARELRRIKK